MKQDIQNSQQFNNLLNPEEYFDLETPYGYGGPLTDNKIISKETQLRFLQELTNYCLENNIVSQFIRFHPILDNQNILSDVISNKYLRDTIFIDTTNFDSIMNNMDSKNRNMVRKAVKNNVKIICKPITEYNVFFKMYTETMARNKAADYYTFKEDYFKSLESLADNAMIMYAMHDGLVIGGAIMFFNNNYMHYHLAGSFSEFRQYSPSNLLLYEAAVWANKHGIKKLHLGGGMEPDDSLFGFKKQFNKNGRLPFTVGRTIFNDKAYSKLLHLRKENDSSFDENNSFMIQYRR